MHCVQRLLRGSNLLELVVLYMQGDVQRSGYFSRQKIKGKRQKAGSGFRVFLKTKDKRKRRRAQG